MLDTLTAEDFAEQLYQPMEMEAGGHRFSLSPVEVRLFPRHALRESQPFAVVFEGPPAPVLAQGTYAFHHPTRGHLELFIVPTGVDARAARYEVIFN